MEVKIMHITNSVNRPKKKLKKVTGVFVHWTANENKGANAIANRNYFQHTTRPASCHLIVDDKYLVECLPWKKGEAEMAYHVGGAKYNPQILRELGTTYPNDCSIGLEICVNADGNFSVAYQNAVKVTAMMLKEHGLGINRLYRHYDSTYKNCPAFFVEDKYAKKYFGMTAKEAWKKFVNDVGRVLEGGTVKSPAGNSNSTTKGFYRVFRNGGQEGAFSFKESAIEFANKLHVNDPQDLIIVKDPQGKDILKLQKKETTTTLYRVRKSKDDTNTQLGSFRLLDNAKEVADKNPGYKVFDEKGNLVYDPQTLKK